MPLMILPPRQERHSQLIQAGNSLAPLGRNHGFQGSTGESLGRHVIQKWQHGQECIRRIRRESRADKLGKKAHPFFFDMGIWRHWIVLIS
jgi:hypothetical protein